MASGLKERRRPEVFVRGLPCHGDHGQGGQYDGKSVGAINDPDFGSDQRPPCVAA
jgi:hypothetical protein